MHLFRRGDNGTRNAGRAAGGAARARRFARALVNGVWHF
jgi:hypothetical protein